MVDGAPVVDTAAWARAGAVHAAVVAPAASTSSSKPRDCAPPQPLIQTPARAVHFPLTPVLRVGRASVSVRQYGRDQQQCSAGAPIGPRAALFRRCHTAAVRLTLKAQPCGTSFAARAVPLLKAVPP